MKERPILFTPQNAQKCYEGTKTQTRRIVKPQPSDEWLPRVGLYCPALVDRDGEVIPGQEVFGASDENVGVLCPYGAGGDRLWLRESFQLWREGWDRTGHVIYRGGMMDQEGNVFEADDLGEWTPSIHMPRSMSRTVLEITDIRVERVQEISETDALAEGVAIRPDAEIAARVAGETPARMEFWALWESINGAGSWAANPWVWAITFKRVTS